MIVALIVHGRTEELVGLDAQTKEAGNGIPVDAVEVGDRLRKDDAGIQGRVWMLRAQAAQASPPKEDLSGGQGASEASADAFADHLFVATQKADQHAQEAPTLEGI